LKNVHLFSKATDVSKRTTRTMSSEKQIKYIIGIAGAGAMGTGIAQIAATAEHKVVVYDPYEIALNNSELRLKEILSRLVQKNTITIDKSEAILNRIEFTTKITAFSECSLIIEAVFEDSGVKKEIFNQLDSVVSEHCVLATNTSSLSIASIAAGTIDPTRIIGLHFFNPPPLMPLVEIIPGIQTRTEISDQLRVLMLSWNKVPVLVKDTPGFIVNRVARPFYGEAIRIFEEGIATIPTIDWAMKELGGFRMGPFELMDFIGNDINYKVTETVWEQMFFDAKYKPSLTQKRLFEAGMLGRKSGTGYYKYGSDIKPPDPLMDKELGNSIMNRILVMLINEAVDAYYLNIATMEDIDLAMTKGVNYPKGLLKWCDELGAEMVCKSLIALHEEYLEERYRPSPLLRKMAKTKIRFYQD
jgi:3-hydroxybutyryl-CoA dehydrogenase